MHVVTVERKKTSENIQVKLFQRNAFHINTLILSLIKLGFHDLKLGKTLSNLVPKILFVSDVCLTIPGITK